MSSSEPPFAAQRFPDPPSPEERCVHCEGSLSPGFLEDSGQSAPGSVRWIPGPLERGLLGGVKRFGKDRYDVDALRCDTCGRLELRVR